MLTVTNDNTQFGMKYVGPATIKGKIRHRWRDVNVNVFKFETNLDSELHDIDAINYLWCGKNLSSTISDVARRHGGGANVYALTAQEKKFDRIDPSKVLGIMTTGKITKGEPTVEVFQIGTHPKFAYAQNKNKRELKHIAKALIETFSKKARKSGVEPVVYVAEPGEEKFLSKVGLRTVKQDLIEII